jgi:hypothetical protein
LGGRLLSWFRRLVLEPELELEGVVVVTVVGVVRTRVRVMREDGRIGEGVGEVVERVVGREVRGRKAKGRGIGSRWYGPWCSTIV